jgi:hypothetical protein
MIVKIGDFLFASLLLCPAEGRHHAGDRWFLADCRYGLGHNGIGNSMLAASANFNVPLVFSALLIVGFTVAGRYAIFVFLETCFLFWPVCGRGLEYATGG